MPAPGGRKRFATLEAAQAFIMFDLLGYDEGAWDEGDVESASADFEARFSYVVNQYAL